MARAAGEARGVARKTPVTRISIDDAIDELETFVARMEERYERQSELMDEDVRAGRARETAEVCRWLGEYQVLKELRAIRANGREPGSTSSSTG